MTAVSCEDGRAQWRYGPPPGSRVESVVTLPDSVFVLIYQQLPNSARRIGIVALEANDGQVRWQRLFPQVTTNWSVGYSVNAAGQTVYVSDTVSKTVTALRAADGVVRWQQSGECRDPRLAVEGLFFAACGGQLTRFDEMTGQAFALLPSGYIVQLGYSNGLLATVHSIEPNPRTYQGQLGNMLLNVWADSFQQPLWHVQANGPQSGLWVDKETLIYRAGNVARRARLQDGTVVWETPLPDEEGTNLLRVGSALLVGSKAGYLYALDWESGFQLWRQDLWASLRPRSSWPWVTVVGASERAIFLKIGSDLVSLVTDGKTTWPSPTPTPTSPPKPAVLQPTVPLPVVSAPPADWTPPPLADVSANSAENLAQVHIQILANFLNAAPGHVEEAIQQYAVWASPQFDPERVPIWAYAADLDRDGAQEWVISILWPRASGELECGSSWCPTLLSIFERQGTLLAPAHIFATKIAVAASHNTQVMMNEDINNDGKTELVLSTYSCGAHTCFTGLQVGQWDGYRWRDLGQMSHSYAEVDILDRDGDGVNEIVMHGGTVGSAGAGMQRRRTYIYAWENGRYALIETITDFMPDNIYYLMLDANAALATKDWERALELSTDAMSKPQEPKEGYFLGDWERARIVSYAAIEAMLVHAQRGEVGAMEALLREVENKYDRLDNPYVEAAQRLWNVYRDTHDPILACQAVERTVRERQSQAGFLRWYGYATETLPVAQICPLDDD